MRGDRLCHARHKKAMIIMSQLIAQSLSQGYLLIPYYNNSKAY